MILGFAAITAHITALTGVESERLFSTSKKPAIIRARELLIYLAHEFAGMSYPEIAYAMRRRNHSACCDGAARFRGRLVTTLAEFDALTRQVQAESR